MSQENIEAVRRALAFWGELGGHTEPEQIADLIPDAALQEFIDPEVEVIPTAQGLLSGNTYTGYQGIRSFWADFFTIWDEFRAEPQRLVDTGAKVVSVIRLRGRVHELEVDEVWSHLWTVSQGRIVRVQTFASADGALEAAGLRA
jgi:ketosteroid isomerase-like protein